MTSPADPTPEVPQYDAFLSHNSREKEFVERIARRLEPLVDDAKGSMSHQPKQLSETREQSPIGVVDTHIV